MALVVNYSRRSLWCPEPPCPYLQSLIHLHCQGRPVFGSVPEFREKMNFTAVEVSYMFTEVRNILGVIY